MARVDPYRSYRFRVEIDGIAQAGFKECLFEDVSTAVIEYREGTDPLHSRKLSGLTKYGNIILKWGITDSIDLYDWSRTVIETGASSNRKNIAIILVDEEGSDKARWELYECWPIRYGPPDFDATADVIAIEILEIATEQYRRVA